MHDDLQLFREIAWPPTPFDLVWHLVLAGRRGSEAHGTYVPPEDDAGIDDRDVMGIVIPPAEYLLGVRRPAWEGSEAIRGPWDVVLYDYRKFVRLLCKQNPNALSLLWLREEDYLFRSPEGQALVEHRDLFRARRPAYEAFIGYARGQLHRMNHWVQPYRGYMGAKRKALVDRFGYDTKNAAHLIRLLHMGVEYLRQGVLHVRRTDDRDALLAIKRGEWSLPQVMDEAERSFIECQTAYENSAMPEAIDTRAVEELVVTTLRDALLE